MGLCGLALLYLSARWTPLPRVAIRDITPLMNFACVSVQGQVPRAAYVARRDGKPDYLSFSVDDGSGRLRATAHRDVARELVARGNVPRAGDRVEVSGSLNVAAGTDIRLRLQTADQVRILPPQTALPEP